MKVYKMEVNLSQIAMFIEDEVKPLYSKFKKYNFLIKKKNKI